MFKLVLHGSKDASPAGVQALKIRLAQKLGLPGPALDALFSELPYTMKENLTESQAHKLKKVIDELGAVTEVEEAPDIDLTLSPPAEDTEGQTWHKSVLEEQKDEEFDLTLQPDAEIKATPEVSLEDDSEFSDLSDELDDLLAEKSSDLDLDAELAVESIQPEEEVLSVQPPVAEETELDLTGGLSFEDEDEEVEEPPQQEEEEVEEPVDTGLSFETELEPEPAVGTPPPKLNTEEAELEDEEDDDQEEEESSDSVDETGYVNLTPEQEEEILAKAYTSKPQEDSEPGEVEAPQEISLPEIKKPVNLTHVFTALAAVAVFAAGFVLIQEPAKAPQRQKVDFERIEKIVKPVENTKKASERPKTTTFTIDASESGVVLNLKLELNEDRSIALADVRISSEKSEELTKQEIVARKKRTPWLASLQASGKPEIQEDGSNRLQAKAYLTDGVERARVIAEVYLSPTSDGYNIEAYYLPESEKPTENFFGRNRSGSYEFYLTINATTKP